MPFISAMKMGHFTFNKMAHYNTDTETSETPRNERIGGRGSAEYSLPSPDLTLLRHLFLGVLAERGIIENRRHRRY
jgi:hypothetical protein